MEDNRQRVRIALLGPNGMFGQEEILNRNKRKSKAVCVSSKCTIFYIQKEVNYKFYIYFSILNRHFLTLLKIITLLKF